jgi:FMN phosphatase YigB (HAD superfamily)
MRKYSAVFFDFDGVLCTDRFYSNIKTDFPLAMRFINEAIFDGVNDYANRWMRGEFSYYEINKLISEATSVPFTRLTELFIASVRQMRISPTLIQFALSLKQKGIKIALVTDNMDIFNEITIPEKRLADVFPVIINSFDHKRLKLDDNGKLFDIALDKLGLDSYQEIWLIDNSPSTCTVFSAKGGHSYQYVGLREFETWVKTTSFE